MFTAQHSTMINAVGPNYSIDLTAFEAHENLQQCEQRAEDIITAACSHTASEDLGGITVYFKGQQLVAFYDYERFVGHVF
jgi:hypothetical protein